jgi:hypothetical protein
MKNRTNTEKPGNKRTLWRDSLMAIIGLTMGACGLGDSDANQAPLTTHTADTVSQSAPEETAVLLEKQRELDEAKRELKALRDEMAKAPKIKPPTLTPPAIEAAVVKTGESKPGKLSNHNVAGDIGVVASAMAIGVDKRIPLGVGTSFSSDVEKIWAFIKVKNKNAPTKLRMVWKRDGKQRMAVDLRVGKSKGWRTWSYKRMGRRDAGQWTVDVLTQDGTKLHSMAFEVTPAAENTDFASK